MNETKPRIATVKKALKIFGRITLDRVWSTGPKEITEIKAVRGDWKTDALRADLNGYCWISTRLGKQIATEIAADWIARKDEILAERERKADAFRDR